MDKTVKPLVTIYTSPKSGKTARFEYLNADSFDEVDTEKVKQVYAVCILENKMVVVKSEFTWTLPGGSREKGENIEQTLRREVKEETNMEVLQWKPVGIQTVFEDGIEPYLQLRTACLVRPYGPFVSDPDGDVTEVKLVDPDNYREYLDWGEIGETIVRRAIDIFK
jgi:8-oxo-dGTP diphosphatase